MQKEIKIILLFFILTLITSCGFKKINQDTPSIYLQEINVTGEKRIAYAIKNNIILLSDKNAVNKISVRLIIQTSKSNKVKNKKGKVTRYDFNINGNLILKNIRTKEIIKKSFSRNTDYAVGINHSDTINNERKASKILVERLSEQITNFIIFTFKN